MAWDSDKSTAADPDNPQADEQLTADEWDNHVSEGHFPSDELNFGVDGNGDPVITDPQNGGQTVMRYDRSAGNWVVDALDAGEAETSNETFIRFTRSTQKNNISSGTFANVADGSSKDVRGEESNGQFTPDKSGEYDIEGIVILDGGNQSDDVDIKLHNVTDSTDVDPKFGPENVDVKNFERIPISHTYNLTSGKTYELQATDLDSKFNINQNCEYIIRRSVVQ